ncbi:MAG: class I SAM-dependent methyltransferase [Planctomycetota bacterium]
MSRNQSDIEQLYREDLAAIHVDGYGFHWEQAAPSILSWLKNSGINSGMVCDLGCGGGQWLNCLIENGYRTTGIDVSPAMIELARKAVPGSALICGSFADIELPSCDAVTSLGEPLNYLNSGPLMKRAINNAYASLKPGGLFIFDVRHPSTGKVEPVHHAKSHEDWFCYARIEESGRELVRHIQTFVKNRGGGFTRNYETHRLRLFSRAEIVKWLRQTGFKVRVRRSYGEYKLADRQSVFLCRKP